MKKDYDQRLKEISAFDQDIWTQGHFFAGIDEAGRGPLAGPVYAACVVMPIEPLLLYVDDSKKVTQKRRDMLYDQIMETAIFAGVASASAREIDEMNILEATKLAMCRAAQGAPCELFYVDAIRQLDVEGEVHGIIRGDSVCYSIAAASILAKVARDREMIALAEQYPQYGFAQHKGYGTRAHIDAIGQYGPCEQHRRSFIRNFV